MGLRQFILKHARKAHARARQAEYTRWAERSPLAPLGEAALTRIDRYIDLQHEYARSLAAYFGGSLSGAAAGVSPAMLKHAVDGAIKPIDALMLADLVTASGATRILEVGSFLGFSTRWLLDVTAGTSAHVTSLDPRVRHRVFDDLKGHLLAFCAPCADRLTCVDAFFCERNDPMFLHDYLNYAPKLTRPQTLERLALVPVIDHAFSEFDLAFIDGDHGYHATIRNVYRAATMIPDGGTIIVHDALTWPDVRPALQTLCTPEHGLRLLGVGASRFHERFASVPDVRGLADGLGVVRVVSRALVDRIDLARCLDRRA